MVNRLLMVAAIFFAIVAAGSIYYGVTSNQNANEKTDRILQRYGDEISFLVDQEVTNERDRLVFEQKISTYIRAMDVASNEPVTDFALDVQGSVVDFENYLIQPNSIYDLPKSERAEIADLIRERFIKKDQIETLPAEISKMMSG
ncbi:hypothetical protein [Jeotgalibacillus sp. R-1-5s-1]|uniref:hypothetical protein n=1 Tax=Jeotgalibacillus sp. R-1-5s-1 TaxID=2555897 RepID=UPI00106D8BCC|nr:hypothetical protein [Jeotgalibacillus sp. R-1-5s-1]TFD94412.1 hypothetical protein E2491_13315 [Jeotgalibacillus sp. R-1-5s-1]